MAALIMVSPGRDWQASGALFDWTLEFLIARVADESTGAWLRTVLAENLGSLWLPDLPTPGRAEVVRLLRERLLPAAERELPEPALPALRELIALTWSD